MATRQCDFRNGAKGGLQPYGKVMKMIHVSPFDRSIVYSEL